MLTAAVCVALSGAGLAAALVTAWRRRFSAAARLAAVALLPIGLYLAGLITLGARIGSAVGGWGAGLVFDPAVWAGFAVLAAAVLLYAAGRLAAGRRKSAAAGPSAVRGGPAGPAVESGRAGRAGPDGLSEFKDIEEILRKRGL